ncbi:MAG: hypothetical protein FGF51_08650 [Candidatus Brockarchaeota archaeon]|nr:hypothetical protein [Candidatus Brockarchaeota archaeon]
MRKPIRIEVYDMYPITLGHCPHYNLLSSEMYAAGAEFCELSSQVSEYPNDVIENNFRVVGVVRFLRESFKGVQINVEVEMVNLLSPIGFMKSLRHGIWKRPAILVNGKKVSDGFIDWERLKKMVEEAWAIQESSV